MKSREFAKQYRLDHERFEIWIRQSAYRFKYSAFLGNIDVEDGQDFERIARDFQQWYAEQKAHTAQEEQARREAAEQAQADEERKAREKQAALASMLITSGFSFDGYTITKYSGYISGDDAVQIERGTDGFFSRATDVGASLMSSLAVIRRNALSELKEAAYALGCNAVIGVDFDYLTLDPETAHSGGGTLYLPYVFGVTANGNAVVIERTPSPAGD